MILNHRETGETAQCLRALADFAKDLGSIPSIHTALAPRIWCSILTFVDTRDCHGAHMQNKAIEKYLAK